MKEVQQETQKAMVKDVAIYELKARNPRVVAFYLATDLISSTGIELKYEKDFYGKVYYIYDGLLVITKRPYCWNRERIFIIRNGNMHFQVESLETPVIVEKGEEFLEFLRRSSDLKTLCVCGSGWRMSIGNILTDPQEKAEFERLMSRDRKFYNLYWYGGYIDKQTFLEIIDTVKQSVRKQEG
jgi:hypothetical protein